MAKSYNQKMKILYLMQAFLERTDEAHVLSMQEILVLLNGHGIHAERKTIYDDIEVLRVYGLDIIYRKEAPSGYYLASRNFELPELKLLVDVVQSSKFITERKSAELIQKLEGLTSHYEAQQLQRQVFVANRIKTMNESIYYNVDKIHGAILADVKISFQYFEWTVEKQMHLKKSGQEYCISPWALTWAEENYYLIGYDEKTDMVKHYRVDKMLSIKLMEERRSGKEHFADFNTASFAKKTFGMFGGEEQELRLEFENRFVGVVIDRFGKDAAIRKKDETHFAVRVKVVVSPQFFGWLSGLGTGAKIVTPKVVQQEYKQFLQELLNQYQEGEA